MVPWFLGYPLVLGINLDSRVSCGIRMTLVSKMSTCNGAGYSVVLWYNYCMISNYMGFGITLISSTCYGAGITLILGYPVALE